MGVAGPCMMGRTVLVFKQIVAYFYQINVSINVCSVFFFKDTVGSTVKQRHPSVMHQSQTKVNPNLIMVPLIPITYTSAQLHEKTINSF